MYRVITDFERPDAKLVDWAAGLYVCLAGIEVGPRQVVDSAIKPLCHDWKICGPAFTVRPEYADDSLMSRVATKYVKPGDVLVIDAGGRTDCSNFGASMAGAAKDNGCVGVVVDGVVLTGEMLRKSEGLPVFCRGTVARNRGAERPGWLNGPVICGGVIVYPGDLVLGDDDGVVIVPKARIAEILAKTDAAGRKSRDGRISGVPYDQRSKSDEKLRAIPGVVFD
ncbi:MAG: 4-hydroxy-4-methyl-2-oxoglutarate aldolase [Alphaproteobacteria bacterium]|nr:4-hydroxy-4-methyl-2-oxoglutarate aldolase [Alphaproteobacteria bacterium]